jgi:hypothetical protein
MVAAAEQYDSTRCCMRLLLDVVGLHGIVQHLSHHDLATACIGAEPLCSRYMATSFCTHE